jgi:hypothetical protein
MVLLDYFLWLAVSTGTEKDVIFLVKGLKAKSLPDLIKEEFIHKEPQWVLKTF